MKLDFTTIDKSDFECIQMGDAGSTYFGQVMYMNSSQPAEELRKSIEDIEDEEQKQMWEKVRHGCGIQLFGKSEGGVTCKYAGEWVRDERTGDGHQVYPDGSEYKGDFVKGVFNGMGLFWWPASKSQSTARHHYKGFWHEGKMHGKGEFRHADTGDCYKGFFANNLYAYSSKGQKHFLNPFETKDQHKLFIEKAKSSVVYNKKQEEEKQQKINLFRVSNVDAFNVALAKSKADGRTPLIVTSHESLLRSQDVMEALHAEGSSRSVVQLYLRNLALEVQDIPYDSRDAYLDSKYGFEEQLLNQKMIGQSTGQVLLNFDEMEGADAAGDSAEEAMQAQEWKHLYDADYELLFNQRIFPVEMLQGNNIGLYMIHQFDLFDRNLQPHNIHLSKPGELGESHTIQFAVAKKGSHIDSMEIESKNELAQESQRSPIQSNVNASAVNASQANQSQLHTLSHSSPRSTMSEQTKLKKQIEKLQEMKQEALEKLIGLSAFQLMFFSKADFSQELSDEVLLDRFKKRFEVSLPLKHFDMVFVNDLGAKPPTPLEQMQSQGTNEDGTGS